MSDDERIKKNIDTTLYFILFVFVMCFEFGICFELLSPLEQRWNGIIKTKENEGYVRKSIPIKELFGVFYNQKDER